MPRVGSGGGGGWFAEGFCFLDERIDALMGLADGIEQLVCPLKRCRREVDVGVGAAGGAPICEESRDAAGSVPADVEPEDEEPDRQEAGAAEHVGSAEELDDEECSVSRDGECAFLEEDLQDRLDEGEPEEGADGEKPAHGSEKRAAADEDVEGLAALSFDGIGELRGELLFGGVGLGLLPEFAVAIEFRDERVGAMQHREGRLNLIADGATVAEIRADEGRGGDRAGGGADAVDAEERGEERVDEVDERPAGDAAREDFVGDGEAVARVAQDALDRLIDNRFGDTGGDERLRLIEQAMEHLGALGKLLIVEPAEQGTLLLAGGELDGLVDVVGGALAA